MSEYKNVEKPFLNSLESLGWQIIDQGCNAIPQDATLSLRSNFREIVLRDEFIKSVRKINLTDDGQEWLIDKQLVQIYDDLLAEPYPNLLAANRAIHELITKKTIVIDCNELIGEQFVKVKLIDFENISANSFIAINQFRVDTIGTDKSFIIPDIVLFVNGLPLVVIECKDFDVANPIHEAVTQIHRYANLREATKLAGLREGEERLFWFNLFSIATYANVAKYGTITSDEEFYFEWKDIYPPENLPYGVELSNLSSQDKLICGMLAPANLLDILRSFTLFETTTSGVTIKKVPRYQQYRAVSKIIQRLATGITPLERSGVIWHTQGSGKSLTMVMLIRKLRTVNTLKAFKILLVNDRIDLEDQLGETALLTNEKIDYVENTHQLREKLATPSSNVVMVMIHKFQESQHKVTTRVGKQLENVNLYRVFKEINPAENILVLIDEAHRTQGSEMGDNLFTAFPNATRIAFTGTPLITERHNTKTVERFGSYIDKYKLQDAVDDGATLQIIYEGRSADSAIYDKMLFEEKLNSLLHGYSPEEQAAIRQKYGTSKDVLDAPEHVNNVANDLVNHYIDNILPNGFKAQVVANSVIAAVRYKHAIMAALQARIALEAVKSQPDSNLTKLLTFISAEAVVSSQGTNEAAIITNTRKSATNNNAISGFLNKIDYAKPISSCTFLVVCDMLLTGFDAPIEQVMYIDTKLKEHNLLQAIARVNRTAKGKSRGYIVDYCANPGNLKEALSIYSQEDANEVMQSFKDINSEIPILEHRYRRIVQLFSDNKIIEIEAYLNQILIDIPTRRLILEKCVDLAENIEFRANFEVYLQHFLQSMDIILPNKAAEIYKIPAKHLGDLLFAMRQRYKDDSLTIANVGEKIKLLINEHLISIGVNPKIPPTELFSPNFIKELNKSEPSKKSVASEMEHAIRKHIKVNMENDPALYSKLYEKLEEILKKYREDWEKLSEELQLFITKDVEQGRKDNQYGLNQLEAIFFDFITQKAKITSTESFAQTLIAITKSILIELQKSIIIIDFWNKPFEIKHIKSKIVDTLIFSGIDELADNADYLTNEIVDLAKHKKHEIVKYGTE